MPTYYRHENHYYCTFRPCILNCSLSLSLLLLIFSCMTDETMLGSRQPTQEELDEPPTMQPAAHPLRRRLLKTANLDLTSMETDELSPR